MVEGQNFTLYSDHQSLVPSMTKKSDPQTARQIYQLACISEFTTDIRYVEGKANIVADALSRPPLDDAETATANAVTSPRNETTGDGTPNNRPKTSTTPAIKPETFENLGNVINAVGQLGLNLEEMARDQPLDQDYVRLAADARTGLQFKSVDLGVNKLIVDISNGPARPFVPFSWRRRVFEVVHNLGHPGIERTRQSIAAKFVWPSMREDTTKWARECLTCQRSKVLRNTIPPIGDFTVPNRRFDHWNVDLVTLPVSNGFRYLLTAVDRFTRWPIAVPLKDMSAESVLDAFAHGLIATFGVPSAITTDRGGQFSSAIWRQLMTTWGVKTHFTTAYHPAANGLVERFHRRLKEALVALTKDEPSQWFWRLPCALLAIRTTLKPDVGASPADLVYGEGLAVPGTLLSEPPASEAQERQQRTATLNELRLEVARLQPAETSAHRTPHLHIPTELQTATHVFIRRGGVQPRLTSPYVGPYRVISRDRNSYRIALPGVGSESISIERLKPALASDEGTDDVGNNEQTPPSPPPPGLRPGVRTRAPPPTDRQTQQSASRCPNPPVNEGASTSTDPHPTIDRRPTGVPNIDEIPPPPPSPPPETAPPTTTAPPERRRQRRGVPNIDEFRPPPTRSGQPLAAQERNTHAAANPDQPLSFDDWLAAGTSASAGRSDRRRPNVSALTTSIRNHLGLSLSNS